MRTPYDDVDEFDFADNLDVRRIMREQKREELRLARRRSGRRPGNSERFDDLESNAFGDFGNYGDTAAVDYDDYDEDEFDSYSDLGIDH